MADVMFEFENMMEFKEKLKRIIGK